MHLLNTLPQRLDPGATPTFAGLIASSLTSPASIDLTLTSGLVGTNRVNFPDTLSASSATAGAVTIGNGTAATNVAIGGGKINIGDTTAGASNAGALVVAGGLATGAASYFGGAVTVNDTIRRVGTNGRYQDIVVDSSASYFDSSHSLNVRVNGASSLLTALTIASTGAATFAGAVSVGTGAAVGGATAGAGGLAFPAIAVAVADANTLDDYEEGTWTPTVAGATTAGTVAYFSQYGYYTKIGRLLYVWFDLNVSSFSGGVGGLTITNLPFPNANITNFYATFQPWFVDSVYASTYTTPTGSINPNTSVLILYSTDDGHANFASMNVNQIGRIAGYFMMQTT